MPLFFTPKPRQFHYEPRFYDPEKEKWEALKRKYAVADDSPTPTAESDVESSATDEMPSENADLHYFEEKLRQIERSKRHEAMSWRDLFRKREMPKFNYQPRFQNSASATGTDAHVTQTESSYSANRSSSNVRIRRRYNMDDPEYMKPVSASKIMLYVLLACILLYWILF